MNDDYQNLNGKIEIIFLKASITIFILSVLGILYLTHTKPKEIKYKHKSTKVKEDAPWNKNK